jgi:hypothetical protein
MVESTTTTNSNVFDLLLLPILTFFDLLMMRNDQPMMVYDIHLELYIRLRSFLIQLF